MEEKKKSERIEGNSENSTVEQTDAGKKTKKNKKKSSKHKNITDGRAYINATFNNTIVTITDDNGHALTSSSAGKSGFKGTKKSTPYAAQVAAEKAAEQAKLFGMERVKVFVKGIGSGREQAVRGLHSAGLDIESIYDATPVPHNGCRARKARRV